MKRLLMFLVLTFSIFTLSACDLLGTTPIDDIDSTVEVQAVIALINALPEIVTLDDQTAVQTAITAYNELATSSRAAVTNYNRLQAAELRITNLLVAKAVDDMIAALPATITLTHQSDIEVVRTAFDLLSTAQKALVTKLDVLIEAETSIANMLASSAVIELINALPATITLDNLAAVTSAREAFDALTTDQKSLVTNVSKLTAAEATLAEMNVVKAVVDLIAALPATITLAEQTAIEAARTAYESLTATQKASITNYSDLVAAEAALANLDVVGGLIDLIDALPAVITLTNLEAVEFARDTYNGLTTAQQAEITNYAKLTSAEATLEVLTVIALIDAIPAELSVEDIDVIEAASTAYEALTTAQQSDVTNYADLQAAEIVLANLIVAQVVFELIDGLPEFVMLTNQSAVEAARAAYEDLTPASQAYVENYDDLVEAEGRLLLLVNAEPVIILIEDLNDPITLIDETDIEAARIAYSALTEEEKAIVDNYPVLVAAETRIAFLKSSTLTQEILDTWTGDLAFLDAIMTELEMKQQFQMTTVVEVEMYDLDFEDYVTMEITMVDSFLRVLDRDIIQREMFINVEYIEEEIYLNMMFVNHGEAVTVYIYVADILDLTGSLVGIEDGATEVQAVLNAFEVNEDWARYHFEDTLANLVEFEILKLFVKEVIMLEIPELRELEAIEDMVIGELYADKTIANIRLQALFDTFFTFDLNATVQHVYGINFEHLIDMGLENVVGMELLDLLEANELNLKAEGFDYQTLYNTLHWDGFYPFIDALYASPTDAEILSYYVDLPVWEFIDAHKNNHFPNTALSFALERILIDEIQRYTLNTLVWHREELLESGLFTALEIDELIILAYTDTDAFILWFVDKELEANFVGEILGIPLYTVATAYNTDTLTESLEETLLFYLEDQEYFSLGIDYLTVQSLLMTIDFDLLIIEIELFDFNQMRDQIIQGRYLTYFEALPESEMKTVLELFNKVLVPQLEEAAVIFEYATLLDDLSRFQTFMTLDFYGSHEQMEIALAMTEFGTLQANMTLSMNLFEAIALEFLQELWLYIDQLHTIDLPIVDPINCEIDSEDCFNWLELKLMFDYLSDMGALDMILEYDPYTADEYTMFMDFAHMVNYLVPAMVIYNEVTDVNDIVSAFNKFDVHVTMNKTSESVEPIDYVDLNRVAEEAAKVMLLSGVDDILYNVWDHQEYNIDSLLDGTYTFNEIRHIVKHVGIFDLELSTIVIFEGTITGNFYYIDGTPAFTQALNFDNIRDFFNAGPPLRLELLDFITLVDDETFTMTRLLLVFFGFEVYDELFGWNDRDDDYWDDNDQEYSLQDAEYYLVNYINAFNDYETSDQVFCQTYALGSDDSNCLYLRETYPNMDLIFLDYFGLSSFRGDVYVMYDLTNSAEYTFIAHYYDFGDGDIRIDFILFSGSNGDDNDNGYGDDRIDLSPNDAEPLINAYVSAFNDQGYTDAVFCDTFELGSDHEYCMYLRETITFIDIAYIDFRDPLYWVDANVSIDGSVTEITFIVTFHDFGNGDIRVYFEISSDNGGDNGTDPGDDNGTVPIYVPDEDYPGNDFLTRYPDSIRIFHDVMSIYDPVLDASAYTGEVAVYITVDNITLIEAHYINILTNDGWTQNLTYSDDGYSFFEYIRGQELIIFTIEFEYDYLGYYTIYVVYANGAS